MSLAPSLAVAAAVLAIAVLPAPGPIQSAPTQSGAPDRIDLAGRLKAGRLRAVNRQATAMADMAGGVRLNAAPGNGLAWIESTDFAVGTIAIEIRGRDLPQQSFVGVAFHRQNDETYEAVYLRPFNFRAKDPVRHQHAVQYIAPPDFDWPRLRQEFPEEFENPVDASVSPTDWVPVRLEVGAANVRIYVGAVKTPTLEVRRLARSTRGPVGLWVGNNSEGEFANLRLTPAR